MRRFFQPKSDTTPPVTRLSGPGMGFRKPEAVTTGPVMATDSLFRDSGPLEIHQPVTPSSARNERKQQGAVDDLGVIISDVGALPKERYMDFSKFKDPIPATFLESFALLQKSDSKCILLSSSDAFSTHSYFEIHRRLKSMGYDVDRSIRATREIIKTLHAQNVAVGNPHGTETPMELVTWKLIEAAYHAGASDIHIETRRKEYAQVFFRIHGTRIEQPNMSFDTAQNIGNILYTVHADSNSKENSWSIEKIQDSAIERRLENGAHVQLRFSSGPIHPGGNFHIVIRILKMDSESIRPVEDVGYTVEQCDAIEKMLIGSTGLVLLVGPTNSGKSTSLQAFIRRIYDRRGETVKVISVEDPVEYVIPNACQMGVPKDRASLRDKDGSTFNAFLKGTLRQDPDVVMVGEIRNAETASAVKDFVLAGRKILTTLHAYEAFAVFPRLREIGVPESLLSMQGFISGIIYQRLVPTLCPKCSISILEARKSGDIRDDLYQRVLSTSDLGEHDVRVRNGGGCDCCGFTGIVGRTPCAEILVPDDHMLSLLRSGSELAAKAYWQHNSPHAIEGLGVTALAHAIHKMHSGVVDPRDIEIQIGILSPASLAIHLPN